jgi:large subunit ribosomal protein L2
MNLIKFKPTTPTKRHTKRIRFRTSTNLNKGELKAKTKRLIASKKKNAGKNARGVITIRHKGGGVKRKYRKIDFKRDKLEIPAKVMSIEYDPYRTANIALLQYADGENRFIIAPEGLKIGDEVISSQKLQEIKPGNCYPLKVIPAATAIHNIELVPGKGAILGRSAGVSIQLQGKSAKGYMQLKLPSGEIRLVKENCYATIGVIGNPEHSNEKIGKAGTNRKKGIRPTVRGVAHSYKHPHGGGQGKGGRHGTGGPSKDPWGNKRGKITRKNKRTNKYIIKRRTSKLRPRNKKYQTIS